MIYGYVFIFDIFKEEMFSFCEQYDTISTLSVNRLNCYRDDQYYTSQMYIRKQCYYEKMDQLYMSVRCLSTNFKKWNFILNNKYGISTVVQVETDIITRIPTSLIGQAVIMYVGTFHTDVFDNVIMHLMSHWSIISFNRVDISIKVGSFLYTFLVESRKLIWFLNLYLTWEVENC